MKRIAPRLDTPRPSAPASSDARLLPDLLHDQIRRLEVFALVGAGLWAIGLLMDGVVFPWSVGARAPRAALVIEGCAVAFSIGIYVWVRSSSGIPARQGGRGALADDPELGRHRAAQDVGY